MPAEGVFALSLKKDDFISIEITDLDGNRLYFTDTNFDFPDMYDGFDNHIEDLIMIKGRKLPQIRSDTYIYVIGAMKNGDRMRYKTAVSMSSAFQMNIQLRADQGFVMEERRRYYKVKTNQRAYITLTVDSEENTRTLEPPAEILIKDINIGGIFFINEGPESFSKGDKLMLLLNLGGRRLELSAQILRIQTLADTDDKGYGCSFLDLTHSQEEAISRYVYNLQFELLQKERSV